MREVPPAESRLGKRALSGVRVDLRGAPVANLCAVRLLVVADVLCRIGEARWGDAIPLEVAYDDSTQVATLLETARVLHVRVDAVTITAHGAAVEGVQLFLDEGQPQAILDHCPPDMEVQRVGPVTSPSAGRHTSSHEPLTQADDPLALRLALLRFPSSSPAPLSRARLYRADQTLQRWRFKVSGWKDVPQSTKPAGVADAIQTTLIGAADVPTALRQMHRLEMDQQIGSHAKFDAFMSLDRVLALDLGRLVNLARS